MSRRLALVVGINDYPGTNADLRGCVNDALDWKALLDERGYESTVLLDGQARASAIRAALADLMARARWGDRVVFTFSGHGTWVRDQDGDEADARDEALCCHDFESGGLITDDELHTILSARRYGVRVTVVSDSCHSGTMMRFVIAARPRGAPKFLPPPGLSMPAAIVLERATPLRSTPRPTGVLLSGCADNEFSYDTSFGGRPNGAMSFHLLQVLRTEAPGARVGTVFDRLRVRLPVPEFPQTPQLTASAYQRRTSLL